MSPPPVQNRWPPHGRNMPIRRPHHAASRGTGLEFVLATSLILPWFDYGKTYRPVAEAIARELPADHGCLAERGLSCTTEPRSPGASSTVSTARALYPSMNDVIRRRRIRALWFST